MILTQEVISVEKNHLNHFKFLPKRLGYQVYKKDRLHIIHCGLGSSMFNIVYGSPSSHKIIKTVIEEFRGQPFAWWIPPSLINPELTNYLLQAGLIIEAIEYAMVCNLNTTFLEELKTDPTVKPVFDNSTLEDFIKCLIPYDISIRRFYEKIDHNQLQLAERLFVGYIKDQPVTIAILFEGELSTCGIFSLLTCQEEQGKGYGTDMMRFLLQTSKQRGFNYATLSASSDSGYRIYERLGFYKIGEFECFEYRKNNKNS